VLNFRLYKFTITDFKMAQIKNYGKQNGLIIEVYGFSISSHFFVQVSQNVVLFVFDYNNLNSFLKLPKL
jgi:hypothetical protein